jgi:PEP-CTERM motif
MNLNTHPGLVTRLSLLVALAAGFSTQANAVVVSVNSANVSASATATGGTTDANSSVVIPPYTSASANSVLNGNGAVSSAFGGGLFDTFRASASTGNKGTAASSYIGAFTVTNDLATIQSLSLTSSLERGRINMFVTDRLGTGSSTMTWELLVNGMVKNSVSASVVFNPTAGFSSVQPSLTSSSYTTGADYASVAWERTDLFTSLGNLDPGASLNIEMRIVANATSAFNSVTSVCYGYGYGASFNEGAFVEQVCERPGGSIGVSFGDPGDLGSINAITSVPAQVGNVPLPGTVALLGLGLLAFGRSRKKTTE